MKPMRLMIRAALLLLATACGSSESPNDGGPPGACVPGASAACACTSGAAGAQVCLADGTFGACVCSGGAPDGGHLADARSGADAPGPPQIAPDATTSTLDTGPGTCGHPYDASWCDGTDVEYCLNGQVAVSTDCSSYGLGCASGTIGGGGTFADTPQAACGFQCPFANPPQNLAYYCEGTVLWDCYGYVATQGVDCANQNAQCVASGASGTCQ